MEGADVQESQTSSPSSDGQRDRSHTKAADTDGVRQRLKFDRDASRMTSDPKMSKESG